MCILALFIIVEHAPALVVQPHPVYGRFAPHTGNTIIPFLRGGEQRVLRLRVLAIFDRIIELALFEWRPQRGRVANAAAIPESVASIGHRVGEDRERGQKKRKSE